MEACIAMAGLGSGRTHRIVGRVRELTVIRNALEDAGSGKSRVIVFGGPPGIGKTTLAEEACRLGEAESATVCWVRCSDVAPASPLWVWQRIVEQLTIEDRHSVLKKLADFAGEATEQPEADRAGRGRFAVFEAVRRSLVEACAVGLHVVVIDNLQWADIA
ncbi:MAG: ATP-binding protein, partial [Spirochaetia bacterium]